LLRAYGHHVLTAGDGDEGLATAGRETLDLIICDIQLPTLDGFEVARRLKADVRLQRVPLIAVTALAMVGDRDKVLAAGFDGYITKPIVPRTFVNQIEAYLDRQRSGACGQNPGSAERAAATLGGIEECLNRTKEP
jgi:two-component system cell cycle response regulator